MYTKPNSQTKNTLEDLLTETLTQCIKQATTAANTKNIDQTRSCAEWIAMVATLSNVLTTIRSYERRKEQISSTFDTSDIKTDF